MLKLQKPIVTLTQILISCQIPSKCLGDSLRKGKYILWNTAWHISKQIFLFIFKEVIYSVQWVQKIVMG